jgi:hypothetical protein
MYLVTLSNHFTTEKKVIGFWLNIQAKGVPSSVLRLSIVVARDYCPFYGHEQTIASGLRYRVSSVFCVFIVKSNAVLSFHPTMTMKCLLENNLLLFHQKYFK